MRGSANDMNQLGRPGFIEKFKMLILTRQKQKAAVDYFFETSVHDGIQTARNGIQNER